MASFEDEKGLVGKIRGATESDLFDLAGYTEARVRDLIEKSFSTPLETCTEMVKFTFTIGGGKLVRSRYDDSMSKWIVSALKDVNFDEDRSAACDLNSQGTFKQQHDTGQNLKTISVFPFVAFAHEKESAQQGGNAATARVAGKDSAVVSADLDTLRALVASKTESWSQRKRILTILQDYVSKMKELGEKLMRGEMLSPDEQHEYDLSSGCDEEKLGWLQSEIKDMVDKGKLTADEQEQLLHSMGENLAALDTEIEGAVAVGQEQKLARLRDKKEKLAARRQAVQAAAPVTHRLKKWAEIQKIHAALHHIHVIEDKGRSMSMTLADLKKIEPKFDLEQQLLQLQQMSRCWYESDQEFERRCDAELRAAKAKVASKQVSAGSSGGSGGSKKKTPSTSTWTSAGGSTAGSTAGSKVGSRGAAGAGGGRGGPKKISAGAGGFAAAFGDDSDSD